MPRLATRGCALRSSRHALSPGEKLRWPMPFDVVVLPLELGVVGKAIRALQTQVAVSR